MTDYTVIADSEIDPESPGTTLLFNKLRDNPIAITEGSSGAPSVVYAAMSFSEDILGSDIASSTIADSNLVSPSSLKLIENQTAATVSNISFTSGISSLYSSFIFKLDGIRSGSSAVNLLITFSTDGGSSYLAGTNYRYALTQVTDSAVESHTGSTGISSIVLFSGVTNHANHRISLTVNVHDLTQTSNYKNVDHTGAGYASAVLQSARGGGVVTTTSAIDAVRFAFSSGTILSGNFTLYGVAK